jgi:hypothetical protein
MRDRKGVSRSKEARNDMEEKQEAQGAPREKAAEIDVQRGAIRASMRLKARGL